MFHPVIVVFKSRTRVIRRINIDTLNFTRKLLLQCLERQQVVTKYQPIIEDIIFTDAVLGVVGLL